jgi:receptor protein-tyrosine kinase
MSIIEKAVDRLERQDRTAGGEGRTTPSSGVSAPVPPAALDHAFELETPELAPVRAEPARNRSSKEVSLDLDRLRGAGMLLPSDADSQLAEECRLVKRPLLVNAFEEAGAVARRNLVMVTSSMPGEGKTFVSLSLAMSMAAELDRTVLLVDGDVIRGSMTEILGQAGQEGLTDVLAADGRDVGEVMLRTDVPKLVLLPAGRTHPHSTELLASDAMLRLADELSARYSDRIVIFDSPPLLAASGATVLARLVGQILLVVEAERTAQSAVKESLRLLKGLPVTGILLNKARQRVWTGYGYGYRYGYKYGYGYGYRKQADSPAAPAA